MDFVRSIRKDLIAPPNPDMDKNIGRKVWFSNGGCEKGDGLVHALDFEIVGTQKNYKGDLCYRVKCRDYEDRFGCVLPLDRVQWTPHTDDRRANNLKALKVLCDG